MRAPLTLIIAVALLFSMGLLMVFNTTAAEIIDRSLSTSTHAALLKQFAYGIIGIFLGMGLYRWGYESILRWSFPLLGLGTILLLLVWMPGIGFSVNGARRWIGLGRVSFQPSELIKLLLPAAYIHWYLKQEKPIGLQPLIKMLGWLAVPVGLILLEPDNGTAIVLMAVVVVLFFLSRLNASYWALPLGCLICLGGLVGWQMPHVRSRIQVYMHPELDLRGKGHQPHQAKIAAGSGQLFGRGLGESLQKLNYLPEARNDYIAAIYAEETGFVGVLVLIALYGMATYAGFAIALSARDTGGFLFASILTFLIALQAFLNLGIVSGLLPSKGMTLPFFSQGGTSLMVNMAALFVLLDIARKSKKVEYDA